MGVVETPLIVTVTVSLALKAVVLARIQRVSVDCAWTVTTEQGHHYEENDKG